MIDEAGDRLNRFRALEAAKVSVARKEPPPSKTSARTPDRSRARNPDRSRAHTRPVSAPTRKEARRCKVLRSAA